MKWSEVQKAFPNRWVLIEAVKAHTSDRNERILEDVAALKSFSDSPGAMKAYQELHRENPARELYVLHTNRSNPQIIEKKWVGLRR
ncbi:hypothetical protein [Bhargavaea cecembensis]|uniref:hypothetical protein n=1 Tax=Bhargavaea cecembensis TaxID=394098 RepID=UPI000590FD38|nr:hypothetical protein [Bhargavaea cecembensis]